MFFLWIGIFSLMVVAQFWAYANDVYTPDEGKRLFAFIAFGASSGAGVRRCGCRASHWIAVSCAAARSGHHPGAKPAAVQRDRSRRGRDRGVARQATTDISIGGGDAFALLLKSRYLVVMALVILLLNWVNSAGEYILSSIVKHSADAAVQAGTMSPGDEGATSGRSSRTISSS